MSKKFLMLMIAGMTSMGLIMYAAAKSTLEKKESTDVDKAYSYEPGYSLLHGNELNYGSGNIRVLSANEINITGITQCHHVCDKVYLKLYLEQKYNGSYYTYKSWDLSKENASNVIRSMNIIVPKGYYYRVRGYHAVENGTYESLSSLSSGVWVG